MAITDLKIKNLKPKTKGYKVSDSHGLYLFISPKGKKTWRFDYKFRQKRKTLLLGTYPHITLSLARQKRDEAKSLLEQHPPIDPREAFRNKDEPNAQTFEYCAWKWFEMHKVGIAKSTYSKIESRLSNHLLPYLGKTAIQDINANMLLIVLKRIIDVNKIETAGRCLQLTGAIYRYAIINGWVDKDVTLPLKDVIPKSKVKHMAAFTNPKELGQFLRATNAFKGTFTVLCALKLAPMLFCRPGELRKAKWEDINFDEKIWVYDVNKINIKRHIVPLPKQAIEILETLKQLNGNREYVFPGARNPRRPMCEKAVNDAIKRLGYNTDEEITGHGFRATARTILHEVLGCDPYAIEHQLSHRVPDVLGTAYNRTKFLKQRTEMMQRWADYLDELKLGD